MTQTELTGALEAILFAAGEPVAIPKAAEALECSLSEAEAALSALLERYNRADSGVHLVALDGAYQMCSSKTFAPQVRRALELRKNAPLSPAALEVLAIIAYNQPVTKAFLEQVRGVDCSGVVAGLMKKELVEERGRLELPGRPLLYGTTQNFLRCMSISSLEELPTLPKQETPAEGSLPDTPDTTEEDAPQQA